MDVLTVARSMQLPDWWISAGFVRSRVWDALHGYTERTPLGDVDLIYFDPLDPQECTEKTYEVQLRDRMPGAPWSVKNQARMHVINQLAPYTSSVDAMSRYPETATAVGIRLLDDDRLTLAAPWGLDDLLNMTIRPTVTFDERNPDLHQVYQRRIQQKNWRTLWPGVCVVDR